MRNEEGMGGAQVCEGGRVRHGAFGVAGDAAGGRAWRYGGAARLRSSMVVGGCTRFATLCWRHVCGSRRGCG